MLGGAGFIGSHLAERLSRDNRVTVIDNFSSGRPKNLHNLTDNKSFKLIKADLKQTLQPKILEQSDLIFHLAANPEVRIGLTEPRIHFQENILSTFNLLEALRKTKNTKTIIFASTSTVYGEPTQIPTPEDYAPLLPISTYGASKLACEALMSAYADTFNHRALIIRLANVIGPRSNHGVIFDFIRKLENNPKQLEILGDGTQQKSYIHIADCINAIIHLTDVFLRSKRNINVYNIGSNDTITVKEIAKLVLKETHNTHAKISFTKTTQDGRGWKGDVKNMQLSVEKLLKSGWKPKYTSRQAVILAARTLIQEHKHERLNKP